MGLFDKFRKKVREAASEVDSDELSAEEGSDEALEALSFQEQVIQTESQSRSLPASDLISHSEYYAFKIPSVFRLY